MTRCLIVILLLVSLSAGIGAAAEKKGMQGRNSQPIQIKSNELVTDSSSQVATFTGKVVARQDDMTIYCDRLVIKYSEKEKDVEQVDATGSVRIVQGNRMALAARAVYNNKEGKITLTGSPKVMQGDDVVTGKVITYYVDEQKSTVSGGPEGRVEAVIHPKSKEKGGSAKP